MAGQLASDVEKLPSAGVNTPASGTYGEKATVERLTSALPPMGQPQPGAAPQAPTFSPAPPRPTPPGAGSPGAVPGVPGPLLAPSDRPNEPVTATPQGPPATNAVTDAQRRLMVLDQLANSPRVSDETREWARMVLHALAS